jgi:tetratricopeptide (TPR) repeat protein
MMMPAILVVALLAPSPQDAPPKAPAKKSTRKAAKPAAPAAEAESAPSPAAAPAAGGSAADEIQAGLAAFGKRRFTQARAAFERAVTADPQSAAAHYYLGYTIYKIAEPKKHDSPGKKEAAAEFAKAFEIDPAFKPVWGSGHRRRS